MQTTKPVRAAGYVRVLPAEKTSDGVRIDDQRRRLAAYIAHRGWELAVVHQDEGVAARPRNQPAFRSLLKDLSKVDKLVILRLDRLGRSLRRTTELMQQLGNAGVDLVSIEDGFDTGAATGRVLPKLISDLAQWEWWDREWCRNGWTPDNLAKPGLSPLTVIDVGAGHGTPSLYRAFPDAYHALIEPLVEFENDLRRVLSEYRGEYVLTAVGEHEGSVAMNVDPETLTLSSILSRVGVPAGWDERFERREVPITTLDKLSRKHGWDPPFGLKVDTEGFEDAVIRGATRLLDDTQFVIAEVSGSSAFAANHSLDDFIAVMQSCGFRLCDVLHMQKDWSSREVAAIDFMFRRTSAE